MFTSSGADSSTFFRASASLSAVSSTRSFVLRAFEKASDKDSFPGAEGASASDGSVGPSAPGVLGNAPGPLVVWGGVNELPAALPRSGWGGGRGRSAGAAGVGGGGGAAAEGGADGIACAGWGTAGAGVAMAGGDGGTACTGVGIACTGGAAWIGGGTPRTGTGIACTGVAMT